MEVILMSYKDLEEKIAQIPEEIMPELVDFIDFLISRYSTQTSDSIGDIYYPEEDEYIPNDFDTISEDDDPKDD